MSITIGKVAPQGTLLALMLATQLGCATTRQPASLAQAQSTLNSSDRSQLEASRPRLVAQADSALQHAERAVRDGESGKADLLAQQADARYRTAREFAARDQANALSKVMARAGKEQKTQLKSAKQQAQELERIAELDKEVEALDKKLKAAGDEVGPGRKAARKRLQEARKRQSDAVEAGAMEYARPRYEAGSELVSSSVESLSLQMDEDAEQTATLAIAAFDAAIRDAERARAEAEQQGEGEDKPEQAAQAAGPQQGPQGWDGNPQPATPPDWGYAEPDQGMSRRAQTGAMAPKVEDRLVKMQFERAELIGEAADELCGADFRQFTELLALSERRFQVGDVLRAHEFLVRADERLGVCRRLLEEQPDDGGASASAASRSASAEAKTRQLAAKATKTKTKTAGMKAETPPMAEVQESEKQRTQRTAAEQAIAQAEQALVSATATGQPQKQLEAGTKLLAFARDWFDRKAYGRAEKQAKRVGETLKGFPPTNAKSEDGPQKGARAAVDAEASADCTALWKAYDKQQARLNSYQKGEKADGAAREAITRQPKELTLVQGLLTVSQRRLRGQECAAAEESLQEAENTMAAWPEPGHDANNATKDSADKLAETSAQQRAPDKGLGDQAGRPDGKNDKGDQEGLARTVNQRIERLNVMAERAAYVATERTRRDFDRGTAALTAAQLAAADRRYDRAMQDADRATRALSRVLSAAERSRSGRVERRLSPTSQQRSASGSARDEGFDDAYRRVFHALALRDQAHALRGEQSPAVARGDEALGQAQQAWQAQDFALAEELSEQATDAYLSAIEQGPSTPAGNPAADGKPDDENSEARSASYREADVAVRKAEAQQQLCEVRGCRDTDAEAYAEATAKLDSANKALARGKHDYAIELAQSTQEAFAGLLEAARQRARSADDAAQPTVSPELAEAMRELDVQHKLCAEGQCAAADYEGFLRAESATEAAYKAEAAGKADQALSMARLAIAGYQETRDKADAGFRIPQQVKSVTRSGDRLLVSPRIDFESASARLTKESQASVQSLAEVLRENESVVAELRIVGHTDSSGSTAQNLKLSQLRARAVSQALRAEGVGSVQLISDGLGESEPIADNDTADGRAQNRRVEFHLTLKDRA